MTKEKISIFNQSPPAGYEVVHQDVPAENPVAIGKDCYITYEDKLLSCYTADGNKYKINLSNDSIRDIAIDDNIYVLTNEGLIKKNRFGKDLRTNFSITDGFLCSRVEASDNVAVLAQNRAKIFESKSLIQTETVDISFLDEDEINTFVSRENCLIVADNNYCFCSPYDNDFQEWYVDIGSLEDTGEIKSVSVLEDRIIIASSEQLYGFKLENGKLCWKKPFSGTIPSGMYRYLVLGIKAGNMVIIRRDGSTEVISRDYPALVGSQNLDYIYCPEDQVLFRRRNNIQLSCGRDC